MRRATEEDAVTAAEDRTLYDRWLSHRDGDAFAEIARRHGPIVFDLAVRASGDACLAEDMVQEALLDLALAGTKKPMEVGLVAWMARFAICRARNARQSEKSRVRRQRIVGERNAAVRQREDAMPDDRLEHADELDHVLRSAEPDERVVLAMRYLHGWDYGQIADALEVSEGAARVRVHRALSSVRRKVEAAADRTGHRDRIGGGGRNGRGDATLLAGLAAAPLYRMPDGLLEMGIDAALRAAAAPVSLATPAPRVGRLTLQALGLTALLAVSAATAVTALQDSGVDTAAATAAPVVTVEHPLDATSTRTVTGPVDGENRWGGVPRPPDWHRGELSRLGDPDGAERSDASTASSDPDAQPEAAPPVRAAAPAAPGRAGVLRPIQRDMRAATRVPASSEGERAGISHGRTAARSVPLTGSGAEAAASDPGVGPPGLPAGTAPAQTVERRDPRDVPEMVPLAQLSLERQELVTEAAALVLEIVSAEGVDAALLVGDAHELRLHARRIRREYRTARRRLQRAAVAENVEILATETVRTIRAATAQRALALLIDVVLADGRHGVDLVWPDGADASAALQEVIRVLGTLVPDGATALDGAPPQEAPAPHATDALPDGLSTGSGGM